MSFKDISEIAGSAMAAQSVRLNTIASNLANADAVAGNEGETYRARKPVFATVLGENSEGMMTGGKVYEPGHPMANADGMVFYSNVNEVAEMADMMSASRAFETNVEVIGRIRTMQQSLLKLGES